MPTKKKILQSTVVGQSDGPSSESVCVVVLGDIGHSPRMQNHALSFARHHYSVDFIGYGGSQPREDILNNPNIRLRKMHSPPKFLSKLPRLLAYLFKVIWQITTLFLLLMLVQRPKYMIVQNPPALPALMIALLVSKIRSIQLIVDWHNYAYTVMALTHGTNHPIVRFAKFYERIMGRFSKYHLCVSNAMKEDLSRNWSIETVPMYDRPPAVFTALSIPESHALFLKLAKDLPCFLGSDDKETAFTTAHDDGVIRHRPDRPALIISSTSWTEDEDFGILLNALEAYDENVALSEDLPIVICVITGKGPMKTFYQKIIAEKNLRNVTIVTPWLLADDYPKLLGSADLGVCLHTSSSGLDLPMKVVDMFGCQLPVCAINYQCIDELVKHEVNGLIFNDAAELAEQLTDLLRGFPSKQTKLQSFRENLSIYQRLRWDEAWDSNVYPLLMRST